MSYQVLIIPRSRASYWATEASGSIATRKTFKAAERLASSAASKCRDLYNTRILTQSEAQREVLAGRAPGFAA